MLSRCLKVITKSHESLMKICAVGTSESFFALDRQHVCRSSTPSLWSLLPPSY